MTIDLSLTDRELDIILCALNGTKFDNYNVNLEKSVLLSKLIDLKKKYDY